MKRPGIIFDLDGTVYRGEMPVRFYQIITDGRGSMPGWQGKLSDDQRWDLTFYVTGVWQMLKKVEENPQKPGF
jgi:mono/diheme cytochrome c family protein